METSTAVKSVSNGTRNISAAEERIRHNKMIADRYTSILYSIVLGGLGIVLGSGITGVIYETPAIFTVIASGFTFAAAALTILAISYREEEIVYDTIILSQRRRQRS